MVHCPSCNSLNDRTAAFCSQCGRRLKARKPGSTARVSLRLVLAALVLGAIALVVWISQPSAPSASKGSGSPRLGAKEKTGRSKGAFSESSPDARSPGPAVIEEIEPQSLTLAQARKAISSALVVLELRGEEDRPLREERGILVEADGVVLCRFRPLLGAQSGTCRLSNLRESRSEITGLVYRDEGSNLALVRISWSPVGYPFLPILPDATLQDMSVGEPLFIFGGESVEECTVSENYRLGSDGLARLRVSEAPAPPADAFVAVDGRGFVVGLSRLEVDGRLVPDGAPRPTRDFRVLVDFASPLARYVDRDAMLTLYELTRRRYEGTFADFMARGGQAYRQKRYREAVDFLVQAMDRVPQDRPEEEDILRVSADLKESYIEEIKRLSEAGRLEEAALLGESAAGRYPQESVFLVQLGEARYGLKNWAGGIQVLLDAREREPASRIDSLLEEGYLQLSTEGAQVGDTRLQEADLLAGIQALPASGKLYLELAKLYMKLDLLDQATPLLERVKEISPSLKESADNLLARVDDAIKRREAVIVPIPPGSRSIRTRAVLDGEKDFTFIIDTGATYTTIPSSVAQELGYSPGPPHYSISTAAGIISVPMIQLQSLNLGGYSVHNLEVLVLPAELGPDVGLLGLNFLKHFKYGVDSARSEFRLERP